MADLVGAVASWKLLVVACVVFGLAPGLLLRVFVLAFHRDDPRRTELRGELSNVPRWERPFWVMEQLEVALVEGLGERFVRALTGRVIYRWHLRSGVQAHREHPDTFWIPDDDEKAAIVPGMDVKLIFKMNDGWSERMWVHVDRVGRRRLVGHLHNEPVGIPRLDHGQPIRFHRDDVIDIWLEGDETTTVVDGPSGPHIEHAGCNGHGPGLLTSNHESDDSVTGVTP